MFENINQALAFIENQVTGQLSFAEFNDIYQKYVRQYQPYYIHVTGTNGKGSVSKMLSDILIKAQYKVGLFTSPHMEVANDRVRINNEYISDEKLLEYINYLYADIIKYNINFFQIYSLLALLYFQDQKCDFAIIEVGIGGLYDSTNVIDGKVAIITNIDLDHTEKLGKSISKIAYQKAGIIKAGSFVVSHVNNPEAIQIIKDKALETRSDLIFLADIQSKRTTSGLSFLHDQTIYNLSSQATYQVKNAQIVIEVIKYLIRNGYKISDSDIKYGLENFTWSGRYEIIEQDPLVILDGAHNIAGIKALINSSDKDALIIFSAMKDKDYAIMVAMLQDYFQEVVFAEFDYYRSLKVGDLDSLKTFKDAKSALTYYRKKYKDQTIIFCGSLYFVSYISNHRRDILGSNN